MAQKELVEKVLADIARVNADKGPSTRKDLTRQEGQLLVINVGQFKKIIKGIFPDISDGQVDLIWKDWSGYLSTQAAKLSEDRKQELREAMASIPSRAGTVTFMITGYDAIRKQKAGTGFLGNFIKNHYVKASKDGLDIIGGAPQIDKEKKGVQLGHEQAGVGVATSAVAVMGAEAQLRSGGFDKRNKALKLIYNYYNEIGVSIQHTQVVDAKGGIKKDYVPVVFWQKALTNQEAAALEKAAKDKLEAELRENMATMSGSTPLDEAVSKVIFNEAAPAKKRKGTKVQGAKQARVKDSSKARKTTKTRQKREIVTNTDTGVDFKSISKLKRKKSGQAFSPFSLVAMINKDLGRTVRKNMRLPGLQNTSGRFASSVKLVDVNQTKNGFLSFGYTYEKSPYQVFEVGTGQAPWATPERDPRKLIDKSIREVAAELALGRFYTRRL